MLHYLLILYFWCPTHHEIHSVEVPTNTYEQCIYVAEGLSEKEATTWVCIPTP